MKHATEKLNHETFFSLKYIGIEFSTLVRILVENYVMKQYLAHNNKLVFPKSSLLAKVFNNETPLMNR